MSNTIYALSSAAGRAAVAIIRVSGPKASTSIENLTGLPVPASRRAVLRKIKDLKVNDVIDEGLVVFFKGPYSATGEDLAEFQVHGSHAVIQDMFFALSSLDGLRPAEPGEFARRSFENGKIDLTKAEGIADLIDAETRSQRRQAQVQAGGALERLYDSWRSQLLHAQALLEAVIDFSDESDVSEKAYHGATKIVEVLAKTITKHLQGARVGEIIRTGFRVVIAGPPNAGKSSLLNALAKRDIAIVSDEAGTTRDVIEVRLDLDGILVVITDTAGIRPTCSRVEQEGINRALCSALASDLILWMNDGTTENLHDIPKVLFDKTSIKILNKADLFHKNKLKVLQEDVISLSAKSGEGLNKLTSLIKTMALKEVYTTDRLIPTNLRHVKHLSNAADQLQNFLSAEILEIELRAEDLRIAATELGRLTGRIDPEDILDQIFLRFCIGK